CPVGQNSEIRDQKSDPIDPTSPANPRLRRLVMTVFCQSLIPGFRALSSESHPPPTSPRTPAARRGRDRRISSSRISYCAQGEIERATCVGVSHGGSFPVREHWPAKTGFGVAAEERGRRGDSPCLRA